MPLGDEIQRVGDDDLLVIMTISFSGTGVITKAALAAYYRSVIGLSAARVEEIIDTAYDRMTSVSFAMFYTYINP